MISISNELIDGVVITRNYNKKNDILAKYQEKADIHHRAFFHDEQLSLWIRARIEWCLTAVVACALYSVVVSRMLP